MTSLTSVTVSVPLTIRRRGGRKQIIGPDGAVARQGECGVGVVPVRGDPALIKALARGFRWRRMLEDGRYASISEMAAAEKVERGYLGSLLRLTLLAPDMVEAILDGRQPEGVTLPGLLEAVPLGWRGRPQRFQMRGSVIPGAGPLLTARVLGLAAQVAHGFHPASTSAAAPAGTPDGRIGPSNARLRNPGTARSAPCC